MGHVIVNRLAAKSFYGHEPYDILAPHRVLFFQIVSNVRPGTPADNYQVLIGSQILKINGNSVLGLNHVRLVLDS